LAEPQPATLLDDRARPKRALACNEFAALFCVESFESDL
jgi:hypothetical protein